MSPHEFDQIRDAFEAAAHKLDWSKKLVVAPDERENSSIEETHWYSYSGVFLFSEEDLSEGLAAELIQIAKEI